MEDEAGALEEVVDALLETSWELRALRELLIDHKLVSSADLEDYLEAVKKKDCAALTEKALRVSFEKA